MLLKADSGGWIAIPVRDRGGSWFEVEYHRSTSDHGSEKTSVTLRALTDDEARAIRREELEKWGPPSECEAIDLRISSQKAKEARRAERRGEKAAKEAQENPGEPRMRLV